MELSIDLILQITSMLIFGIIGFILCRCNLVTKEDSQVLSRVCVYVFIPCVLFRAFQGELNSSQLSGLGLAFASSIFIHIVLIVITWILRKTPLSLTREEEASTIYSNAGNLIVPMIYGISSLGAAYVLFCVPFLITQNVLMWSHGVYLVGHDKKIKFRKIFLSPVMIAICIGTICFFLQIRTSGPLDTAIAGLAGCLGPVSMLVIGILMGAQNLKQVFSHKRLYYVTAIRLLVFPLVGVLILRVFSTLWPHPDNIRILMITLLCAIGPAPTTITQLAQIYKNQHTAHISAINVVTTIFCIITMPFVVIVLQWLLGSGI